MLVSPPSGPGRSGSDRAPFVQFAASVETILLVSLTRSSRYRILTYDDIVTLPQQSFFG